MHFVIANVDQSTTDDTNGKSSVFGLTGVLVLPGGFGLFLGHKAALPGSAERLSSDVFSTEVM